MTKFLKFSTIIAVATALYCSCAPKNSTSFAIIVDSQTYSNCTDGINAYRDILISEGMNAMVISSDWQNPDQVKDTILYLKDQKPTLEGVVFVGDIPIVKIRGGQHMTTAFKMNERTYPRTETNVASDRFYDDFDLDFEYLDRDTLQTDVFYYRLTEKGAQEISSDIYSSRILVPQTFPGDKYQVLNDYLAKVVKAHSENNPFDKFIFFAGQGYNSDCLTLWRQKPVIWKDYFPAAFTKASDNRFYNFRMDPKIKYKLFNELQRPDVDFFIFSEHGDFDTQFISGSEEGTNLESNLKLLKESLQSIYKRYYKGQPDEEEFIKEVISTYYLPRSIFSDKELKKTKESYPRLDEANIVLEEIEKLHTGARMVVFDACYNGSFHREGYVAGYHIFNGGKCLVAQGNTVNTLQDKWEDQLIGYLSLGMRVGLWQKEFRFLESHMIGDPTYRFSPVDEKAAKKAEKLYAALTNGKKNICYWKSILSDEEPIYRAAAVKHLEGSISSAKLLKIFKNDESPIVRQQVLEALAGYKDANFTEAVKCALFDRFEVLRVKASTNAGDIGDNSFIAPLLKVAFSYPEAKRSSYIAGTSLSVFPIDLVREAMKDDPMVDTADVIKSIKRMGKELSVALDTNNSFEKRESSIRTFRNNNLHYAVDDLLKVLGNPNEDLRVRMIVCEAFGWFDKSVEREKIATSIEGFLTQKDLDETLAKEMQKTILRVR